MDSSDYQSLISNLAAESPGSIPGKIKEALKDPQQITKHFLEDTSAFLLQDKLKDGLVKIAKDGGLLKKLGLSEENVAKVSKAVKEGGQGVKKAASDALETAKEKIKSVVQKKGNEFSDRFTNARDELTDEIQTAPRPDVASASRLADRLQEARAGKAPAADQAALDDVVQRANIEPYNPQAAASRVLKDGGGGPAQDAEELKQNIQQTQTATKKEEEDDKEEEETSDPGEKVEKDLKKGEKDVEKDGEEDPEMSIPLALGLGVASLVGSFLIKPKKEKIAPVGMQNYSVTIGS